MGVKRQVEGFVESFVFGLIDSWHEMPDALRRGIVLVTLGTIVYHAGASMPQPYKCFLDVASPLVMGIGKMIAFWGLWEGLIRPVVYNWGRTMKIVRREYAALVVAFRRKNGPRSEVIRIPRSSFRRSHDMSRGKPLSRI